MLLQYSIEGSEWILGIGIMFGVAFLLNQLTYKETDTFLIFLTIFNSFMVWCELLPLWTLILCLIITTIIIYIEIKNNNNKGVV